MHTRTIAAVSGLAAALAVTGFADVARAAPCDTLPNPVYVAGSSASRPMLAQVAQVLAAGDTPITLVYQSTGSCAGADALLNGTPVTATANFWDPANGFTQTECEIPAGGIQTDIGISDVYAESCDMSVGAGQADFFGAIQVMTLATPIASSENSISAEAAYLTFGFGGASHAVAPWDSEEHLFIRSDSSGTKQMIAKAIGLPAPKWKGQVMGGSGDMTTAVAGAAQPNKTIGILSTGQTDANRDTMKVLAYQHKGQSCGYYPDSTSTSFDKINVREGRYAIWGPLHYFTNVDGSGAPVSAAGNPEGPHVAEAIRVLTHDGLDAETAEAMIVAEANANTIPLCAMKVTRSSELGDPTPFEPAEPCGCFFESLTGAASDSCTTCTSDSDCGGDTPSCRFGYCEAR